MQEAQIGPATGFLPSWTTSQTCDLSTSNGIVSLHGSPTRDREPSGLISPVVFVTELTWVKVTCLCIFCAGAFVQDSMKGVNVDCSLTLQWKQLLQPKYQCFPNVYFCIAFPLFQSKHLLWKKEMPGTMRYSLQWLIKINVCAVMQVTMKSQAVQKPS